eukprot:TRINITY_DN24977_c0_g1_i1.p1 TRINITY_DN24977_c0_g1~~TRINITY_DN24977_c0_g1_i1.p1  ORF type:complete len:351 (+),score=73.86 TRINITY_DN24977_c0_g1_i1:70-1122(+)
MVLLLEGQVGLKAEHVAADEGFCEWEDEEEDQEEENEELLLALEESLIPAGPTKRQVLCSLKERRPEAAFGHWLVHWPVEVRLCVATFLSWQELINFSLLCRAWKVLELEDALWEVYFSTTWPRLARRRKASADGSIPWRELFRARWCRGSRAEDALEEDWLDFSAAEGLEAKASEALRPTAAQGAVLAERAAAADLRRAMRRCREELFRRQGLLVPDKADSTHVCSQQCRFHRLSLENGGDAFICEVSGALHQCVQGVPCASCVVSADDFFLVCPVSGRCFPKNNTVNEEAADSVACHDWDPELSATQQVGRWFEQGYSMSEDQARAFFGGSRAGSGGGGRRLRRTCAT